LFLELPVSYWILNLYFFRSIAKREPFYVNGTTLFKLSADLAGIRYHWQLLNIIFKVANTLFLSKHGKLH
jgi:hypothetical protein